MKPSIVWFRDDLRVRDNPALRAAVDDGAAVALFVLDEESPGIRPHGGAARWWLHHSLVALRKDLDALGIPLLLRRGPASDVVRARRYSMLFHRCPGALSARRERGTFKAPIRAVRDAACGAFSGTP